MKTIKKILILPFLLFALQACQPGEKASQFDQNVAPPVQEDPLVPNDPPEVQLGERLFRETRFAQFFFAQAKDLNQPLDKIDPILEFVETLNLPLVGPYRAQGSMNCASCHFVDELEGDPNGGVRTYSDFARTSPISAREDGKTHTLRNSMQLVHATIPREAGLLLRFDGAFATLEDFVQETLLGRNFGWQFDEREIAIHHIAEVIRQDIGIKELDGSTELFPYAVLFRAEGNTVPPELKIPQEYRLDISRATDEEIVGGVSKLIGAYVNSLLFSQDQNGDFNGSPYDLFLKRNKLPLKPDEGESDKDYARRLLGLLENLNNPQFVGISEKKFQFHNQEFVFGLKELEGLKMFLREPQGIALTNTEILNGKIGNCVACHAPPNFSDFKFHNTGISQAEYDQVHGMGAFSNLNIPGLTERNQNFNEFLPASRKHPQAKGRFAAPSAQDKPGRVDLGMWNTFANPDLPAPQERLTKILCDQKQDPNHCAPEELLPLAIASFKTPLLRSLGQSAPYMHNGKLTALENVLVHYQTFSALSRAGQVRNASPELARIALQSEDLDFILSFLKSLNEDYN